jgi:hypothetical protein
VTEPHAQSSVALCVLLCVVVCFTDCTGSRSAQSTGPTLTETTDWINDTYKNHGVSYKQLTKNHIFETQDVKTTTLHIDGCVATLEERQEPNRPMSTEVIFVSDLQTFNWADIDPSHIKVQINSSHDFGMLCDDPNMNQNLSCDQADIGLHTRNDRPLIKSKRIVEYPKLSGADHRNVRETTDDVAFLFVNDLEYLPRLVTALKREIELCGGKPSAF